MSELPRSTSTVGERPPAVLRSLLRTSLFSKILVANSAIVVVGAIAGTALAAEFARNDPQRSTIELVGHSRSQALP